MHREVGPDRNMKDALRLFDRISPLFLFENSLNCPVERNYLTKHVETASVKLSTVDKRINFNKLKKMRNGENYTLNTLSPLQSNKIGGTS